MTLPRFFRAAMLLATLVFSSLALAQSWPTRPVRLIVPFPAGGGADMTARVVAVKLSERIGQPVLVDNRPGAAGNIALDAAARAPGDGYTFIFVVNGLLLNPHLYNNLTFDLMNYLKPVSQLTTGSLVLLRSPNFEGTTVPEILKLAAAKPGTVTCGSGGAAPGMACQMLKLLGKVDLLIVPYKGNAPAMIDLMSGQINLLFDTVNTAQTHVKSGRVRAVATTLPKRGSGPFPDLPTVAETIPGVEVLAWQGIMAPATTPAAVMQRVNQELKAVVADPGVAQKLRDAGLEPAYEGGAAFERTVQNEYTYFGKIIRETGMKAE